jgi:hypothetical protein
MSNEIYFYKEQGDPTHQIMHCLVGTYLKLGDKEISDDYGELYPIRIILPPNKSRVVFLQTESSR